MTTYSRVGTFAPDLQQHTSSPPLNIIQTHRRKHPLRALGREKDAPPHPHHFPRQPRRRHPRRSDAHSWYAREFLLRRVGSFIAFTNVV